MRIGDVQVYDWDRGVFRMLGWEIRKHYRGIWVLKMSIRNNLYTREQRVDLLYVLYGIHSSRGWCGMSRV
jgi:hypothetical protein